MCSFLGDIRLLLLFDTQWNTTINVAFGNSGRLLVICVSACSAKSATGHLLPCHPCFPTYGYWVVDFLIYILIHRSLIHTVLTQYLNSSMFQNVAKMLATAIEHSVENHLEAVNYSSAPGLYPSACSPQTQPAIHCSTLCIHCGWVTPSLWQFAWRRILSVSQWFDLWFWHSLSGINYHSQFLHNTCRKMALVMGTGSLLLYHELSVLLLLRWILSLGG